MNETGSSRRRRRRMTCLVTAVVLVVLTLGLGSLVVKTIRGRQLPELTRARFEAAQALWAAAGPPNYELTVDVEGRQAARYHVIVIDGVTVKAFRNGNPLTQIRTMGTWSVPGMFGTMTSDVVHLEMFATGRATPSTPRLALQAEFHPQLGYPQQYRRYEYGTAYEVRWRVTEFVER